MGLKTRETMLSFTVASSSKLGYISDGLEPIQPTVWSGCASEGDNGILKEREKDKGNEN
jgi:hypothetical protein